MPTQAVEAVVERNLFYYNHYRKAIMALFVALVVFIFLVCTLIYQIKHPPAPVYFATTDEGRILPILPLTQPNMDDQSILDWANNAAIAAYTFNFVNYRQELQAASEFFTPDGWRKFTKALVDSNNLNAVIAKKLIVSAVPTGAPELIQKGLLKGTFAWKVRVPMLVTYQNSEQFSQQNVLATLVITRIPNLNSARGIGIAQFIVAG